MFMPQNKVEEAKVGEEANVQGGRKKNNYSKFQASESE